MGYFTLLMFLGICGITFWLSIKDKQKRYKLLSELANSRDGWVKKGIFRSHQLHFSYKEYHITVFSTGRAYTYARVPLPLSCDIVLLICHLLIYQKGISFTHNLPLFKTRKKFHIGHQKFEKAFNIEGNHEDFLRSFLSHPIQEKLLNHSTSFIGGGCSLVITNRQFELCIHHIPLDTKEYEYFLDVVLSCLEQLRGCIIIQIVIFGRPPCAIETSDHILWDPRIAELTVSLFNLQHIMIDTETYSFHQVEQFLTYTVNAIGQKYLKQHVEVHIYGAPERLHPNIKNSLTNLCKQVYEYPEGDIAARIQLGSIISLPSNQLNKT